MSWKRLFNKAKGIKLNVAYVFGGTSVFGVSCYIASTNILCDDNSPKKIIKKVIKRDGSDKILNINIKQKDLNEMFDIIFNWFYLWDLLVMKEGDPKENEINYKEFVLSNFDEDWKLTVNGDGFIDKHDLKKRTHDDTEIDWIDFQLSMANDFESSYSNISPLAFIELKYDHKSGNTYVKLRGTALGNMVYYFIIFNIFYLFYINIIY